MKRYEIQVLDSLPTEVLFDSETTLWIEDH